MFFEPHDVTVLNNPNDHHCYLMLPEYYHTVPLVSKGTVLDLPWLWLCLFCIFHLVTGNLSKWPIPFWDPIVGNSITLAEGLQPTYCTEAEPEAKRFISGVMATGGCWNTTTGTTAKELVVLQVNRKKQCLGQGLWWQLRLIGALQHRTSRLLQCRASGRQRSDCGLADATDWCSQAGW